MPKKPSSGSAAVALSALSCALAIIFLLMGLFSNYLLASGYIMAQLCLMIPLAKGYYVGDALAYLGTCILAVLLGAIGRAWLLVPFALFFGLHPLANALQLRFKINRWIALVIKTVWFDCVLWGTYVLLFGSSIGDPHDEFFRLVNEYMLAIIFVGGSIVFFIYDYIMFKCQLVVNAFVYRIKK